MKGKLMPQVGPLDEFEEEMRGEAVKDSDLLSEWFGEDSVATITDMQAINLEDKSRVTVQKRTSAMYFAIVLSWAILCIPMLKDVIPIIRNGYQRGFILGTLVTFTTVFISYFWLNGIKDLVYPVAYRITPWRYTPISRRTSKDTPSVVLVYVTCNDFSAESLSLSMMQDYDNYEVVILDDSSKAEYQLQVFDFAQLHNIPVVRRTNRPKGYKAGNLNNYLMSPDGQRFNYFVIVDSDEVLPPDFIDRALDYYQDPSVGIVQANHIATRNRTTFMKTFAPGVDAHWPAYQLTKAHAGFLSLLGHGAMVSIAAYNAAGGFPEIVAEDIGMAINAKRAGYRTAFAPDITCEEEFPPDYAAFKKRHKKWTEGNMEFIRQFSGKILFRKGLQWFERLDIVLFTYSLPLTSIFSLYVIVNAIVFPEMHFSGRYPIWMLVPTVAFLLAPMINDVITWRKSPKRKLVSYLLHSVLLFGSVYFASLFASIRTMFLSSVFHVTPKKSGVTNLKAAVRHSRSEMAAGATLAATVEIAMGSVLPVILILIPVIFIIYLYVMNTGDAPSEDSDGRHILQEEDQ